MRYLLIDYIMEYKQNDFIKGIKNVTMSEDFLEFHFPGNPIMPGVLLLESLTQLAAWLQAASSDFKNWFLASQIKKTRFYGFAYPGDQVELRVELISQGSDTSLSLSDIDKETVLSNKAIERAAYQGVGLVNGKKKIIAEFEGDIIPLATIDDSTEQKNFFRILTRNRQFEI